MRLRCFRLPDSWVVECAGEPTRRCPLNQSRVRRGCMPPIVHGRIYPETEGVTLGSRELRVLIDPRAISPETADHLREIDVLRYYLRDIPGQPCTISLLA